MSSFTTRDIIKGFKQEDLLNINNNFERIFNFIKYTPKPLKGDIGETGATGKGYVINGAYNAGTTYHNDDFHIDCVTYDGTTYYAKQQTIGNLPTSTTYWGILAQKGDTGSAAPYDIGEFVPLLYGETTSGSPTYSKRLGYYYRIGKSVTLFIKIEITNKGGMVGRLAVANLPFAVANIGATFNDVDAPIALGNWTLTGAVGAVARFYSNSTLFTLNAVKSVSGFVTKEGLTAAMASDGFMLSGILSYISV